jgi:hypothetical protein
MDILKPGNVDLRVLKISCGYNKVGTGKKLKNIVKKCWARLTIFYNQFFNTFLFIAFILFITFDFYLCHTIGVWNCEFF